MHHIQVLCAIRRNIVSRLIKNKQRIDTTTAFFIIYSLHIRLSLISHLLLIVIISLHCALFLLKHRNRLQQYLQSIAIHYKYMLNSIVCLDVLFTLFFCIIINCDRCSRTSISVIQTLNIVIFAMCMCHSNRFFTSNV